MVQSKSLIYNSIPNGFPVPGETLVVKSNDVDLSNIPEGGVAIKVLYVSLDPYMRGRMRDPSVTSYSPAFELGAPLEGGGIAKIVESANPDYKKGDTVRGLVPHSEYAIITAEKLKTSNLKPFSNPYNLPLQRFVGVLGMPGLTAYASLYDIGELHKAEKETIFVSAASGAVGSLVGQLAKREGLRVVGSAGSDEKVKYLTEKLGFDAAFNYKKEPVKEALPKYIPEGLDIYYDNVGGETLEAALDNAKNFARFIESGMISQYNRKAGEPAYPISNVMFLVTKRLKLQGFIVGDIAHKYAAKFYEDVAKWLHEGSIHYNEDVTVGIDNEPKAFVGMLNGENFGKAVVQYAEN